LPKPPFSADARSHLSRLRTGRYTYMILGPKMPAFRCLGKEIALDRGNLTKEKLEVTGIV
jgi:hypothetical protein